MTTKPEGPAQEPCPQCEGRLPRMGDRYCQRHMATCNDVYIVARRPATPAPSQPAGAREQVMKALDWWQHSNLSIPPIAWNALCTARDALLDAAQQTAAKDAEHDKHIAEFQQAVYETCKAVARECGQPDHAIDGAGSDGDEIEFTVTEVKQAFNILRDAKEAAERERDSLRAENVNMRRAGDSLHEEFMTFVQHTPEYEAERDAAPLFTRCTNPDCEEGSVENGRCPSCDGTGWNRIPFEQVANDLYLASRRGFDAFKVELLAALKAGKDGQQ